MAGEEKVTNEGQIYQRLGSALAALSLLTPPGYVVATGNSIIQTIRQIEERGYWDIHDKRNDARIKVGSIQDVELLKKIKDLEKEMGIINLGKLVMDGRIRIGVGDSFITINDSAMRSKRRETAFRLHTLQDGDLNSGNFLSTGVDICQRISNKTPGGVWVFPKSQPQVKSDIYSISHILPATILRPAK